MRMSLLVRGRRSCDHREHAPKYVCCTSSVPTDLGEFCLQTARLKSILGPWENPDYTVFGETTWHLHAIVARCTPTPTSTKSSLQYGRTPLRNLQCALVSVSEHARVSTCYDTAASRDACQDVITRVSIHLNTVRECDILYDYVGDETIPCTVRTRFGGCIRLCHRPQSSYMSSIR